MKRIKMVGLCLVAAFALSAIAASSASAGEYGQCVAQKHGYYTESNCHTVAVKIKKGVETPDYKGTHEWAPGPNPTCVAQKHGYYTEGKCETVAVKIRKGVEIPDYKGTYEKACPNNCAAFTRSTGSAILNTPALFGAGWECTASTGSGEVTGPKTGVVTITFTNCETLGQKFTSEGEPEGTIKTFPLETVLIDHGEQGPLGGEPKPGEVWTEFVGKPEYGGYIAKFGLTGFGYFAWAGALSGITTPTNVMSLTSSTSYQGLAGEFGPGIGEQGLVTEYNTEPVFPSGIGPFPTSEEVEGPEIHNEEANELKA